MAGNLVKSVMLKIVASDGDAEAKLEKISAEADRLAAKHPDLKVRIDTGAASAKMAVLRSELKASARDAENSQSRFGALGQAINIGLTGGLSGGISQMSMFQKVLLGLNVATGIGEPLVAGLTVAVGGLAAAGTAAVAGLGVFGLVAKSVWGTASTAATQYAAAQKKAALATTPAQHVAAIKAEQAALFGLSGAQKNLAMHIGTVRTEWASFVSSSTHGVAGVLVPALNLVPKALSLMRGFLGPVEGALRGVVSMVSKGLNSQGFASFIGLLQKNAGPAITGFAHAIGNVVVGIGGILRAFMPVSHGILAGVDTLTAKFREWGTTLSSHTGFQDLMKMFHADTPLVIGDLKQLAGIVKTVVSQMTGMSTFSNSKMLLQLAMPVLKLVNALLKAHPELVWLVLYLKLAYDGGRKLSTAFSGLQTAFGVLGKGKAALSGIKTGFSDAEAAAADGASAWTVFGGRLSTAVTAVKSWAIWSKIAAAATRVWTGIQIAFDAVMDANPIALIVIAVVALGAALAILIIKVKPVREFFLRLWSDLKHWFSDGINFIKSHWKLLPAIFLGPLGIVVTIVLTHFRQIENLARNLVSGVQSVLSWFGRLPGLFAGWWDRAVSAVQGAAARLFGVVRTIPGRILSALGNLGSLLFGAGQRVISGLIGGIRSMIGSVGSAISGIAGEITSHLPFSPAKKGPLSGRGDPKLAGMRIATYLAQGITGGTGTVGGAASKMAAAVSGAAVTGAALRPGTTTAAAGAPVEIRLMLGTGDPFMVWLKNQIRQAGGDPGVLTRKVVFA